jgi:predicted dienelactone hydrolase
MHLHAIVDQYHAPSSRLFAGFTMLLSAATVLFLPLSASAFFSWGGPGPAPPPDELGPYGVGHSAFVAVDTDRGDRALPIQIWYPVDPEDATGTETFYELMNFAGTPLGLTSPVAFDDAPVSDRPFFPLVVFSHGSGSINIQSAALMEALASHGFVVASANHVGNTTFDGPDDLPYEDSITDRPKDVSFVIDTMLERNFDPADPLFASINPFSIGVTGHSFGGYTALAMAAGFSGSTFGPVAPDRRVRAVLPVSGVQSAFSDAELEAVRVPVMVLGGTNDTVVPIDPNSIRPFETVGSKSVYRIDIEGPTHSHFANICDIADVILGLGLPVELWPAIGAGALVDPYLETCVPPAYPLSEATRLQSLYTVAFFKRHVAWDLRYATYLKASYADENEPDVSFWKGHPHCGLGFEVVLILPPILWLRDRRRRTARA